jgi:ABC-type nickel/cobalt efflux system permease component RcnA
VSGAVVAAAAGLEIGLVATALALGFRHGFDWDHLAALSDIAASQQSRRRSMVLATMYALGHAAVAFAIGAAVILASAQLPESVGEVMERLVGVTLVALGVWVIVSTLRHGQSTRMPSRGALLVAGFRRLRRHPSPVVIEHEHEHAMGEHHEHEHEHELEPAVAVRRATVIPRHSHRHRHVASLPDDPLPTYGGGVAVSVGMIHGIGFETPTQALVFVTAAGAGSRVAGLLVLACFLAGLLAANTVVAMASTFGLTGAGSRARLYTVASLVAAAASLALGLLYVFGKGDIMPG